MGRRPRARHKVFVFKNAAEMADARAQGRRVRGETSTSAQTGNPEKNHRVRDSAAISLQGTDDVIANCGTTKQH